MNTHSRTVSHSHPRKQITVLFVSSGNRLGDASPIIKNQGESLTKAGVVVEYFTIQGKGLTGYFKNIFRLRKFLKMNKFDVVHAHYSLSGYVAALAGAKPLIVSLMGSDVKAKSSYKKIINYFIDHVWGKTIVKSEDMKDSLGNDKVIVIPNGVDLSRFSCFDDVKERQGEQVNLECKIENETSHRRTVAPSHSQNYSLLTTHYSREVVGFKKAKYYLIWVSNPDRPEKNFKLAEDAVNMLDRDDIELVVVYNKPNELLPYYYNAADALLLTSLWEGSPNVIKEAMACNCPIVSTDVGDVKFVTSGINGCYLAGNDVLDFRDMILLALKFGKRTEGRNRIISLQLDSDSVTIKLKENYIQLFRNK